MWRITVGISPITASETHTHTQKHVTRSIDLQDFMYMSGYLANWAGNEWPCSSLPTRCQKYLQRAMETKRDADRLVSMFNSYSVFLYSDWLYSVDFLKQEHVRGQYFKKKKRNQVGYNITGVPHGALFSFILIYLIYWSVKVVQTDI